MTTEQQIEAIERRTLNQVYVGKLAGTEDDAIWACVADTTIQCIRQCPADTAEQAVAKLYEEVMQ